MILNEIYTNKASLLPVTLNCKLSSLPLCRKLYDCYSVISPSHALMRSFGRQEEHPVKRVQFILIDSVLATLQTR